MMNRTTHVLGTMMLGLFAMSGFACEHPSASDGGGGSVSEEAAKRVPAPSMPMPTADDRGEAVLAGGCFWCVEAVFAQLAGVHEVVSGYAGGREETADYQSVSSGTTDHAEVVRVRYDPSRLRYDQLLRVFFATHDPTQKNRQGPDLGRQYRSAVFYADEHQRRVAAAYIEQLDEAGAFGAPVVTTLEPLDAFYAAEDYHQDFVARNPTHPYVTRWAVPKLEKLKAHFADKLESPD